MSAKSSQKKTEHKPIIPKTVKGMTGPRWNAIARAAARNKETIAEYIWHAHEIRAGAMNKPPLPQSPSPALLTHEVILPDADGMPRGMPRRHDDDEPRPSAAELSLIDLFNIICKFAGTEPAPGNKSLLQEARGVLYARLREAREGHAQRQQIALPKN